MRKKREELRNKMILDGLTLGEVYGLVGRSADAIIVDQGIYNRFSLEKRSGIIHLVIYNNECRILHKKFLEEEYSWPTDTKVKIDGDVVSIVLSAEEHWDLTFLKYDAFKIMDLLSPETS